MFKYINDFPEYEMDENGVVRKIKSGKIIKPERSKSIRLWKNGKRKRLSISKLKFEMFGIKTYTKYQIPDLPDEIWINIEEDKRFWISNLGRVKKISEKEKKRELLIKTKKILGKYKINNLLDKYFPSRLILEGEEWKFIGGYYWVSNLGRVKSNSQGYFTLMKTFDLNGYEAIKLIIDGRITNYYVHRLVATAFIPNPDNKPEIDHINTIRNDNRVENLKWSTHTENMNNPLTIAKKTKSI